MEQNIEFFEKLINELIDKNNDSFDELLIAIERLQLFDNSFLKQLIEYLKLSKLYEFTCNFFPDFEYYVLIIGDGHFIYQDGDHCSCAKNLEIKKKYSNICIHLLTFKIMKGSNLYTKAKLEKEEMFDLIKEYNNLRQNIKI